MTPERLLRTAIDPALHDLATTGIKETGLARRWLVAVALQESALRYRRQLTADGRQAGPAMGYWQFERAGGCRGVLTHHATADRMIMICDTYDIPPRADDLWVAIQYQDVVAAAAARLLLWTLPDSLPEDPSSGWSQYLLAWRPGKPHPLTWAENWLTASEATGVAP